MASNISEIKKSIMRECKTQAIFASLFCIASCGCTILTGMVAIAGERNTFTDTLTASLLFVMGACAIITGRIAVTNFRNIGAIKQNKFTHFCEKNTVEVHSSSLFESVCIVTCNIRKGHIEQVLRFEMPRMLEMLGMTDTCDIIHVESTNNYFATVTSPKGTVFVSRNIFVRKAQAAAEN